MEGDGKATIYAGGWSDYRAQRGEVFGTSGKPKKKSKADKAAEKAEAIKSGLNFTQKHRLETLPSVMQRLEAESAKLQLFMSDPDLFTKEPEKFQKATDGLIERQAALDAAEEEWLELEA